MSNLAENQDQANHQRRFGGIARLYGDEGLADLVKAHVCVIGIGGVGSWVAESLARTAVGEITLIDMDLVSESNINRQILATEESIGRDKVAVMSERIHSINPACKVNVIDDFIQRDNIADLIVTVPGEDLQLTTNITDAGMAHVFYGRDNFPLIPDPSLGKQLRYQPDGSNYTDPYKARAEDKFGGSFLPTKPELQALEIFRGVSFLRPQQVR